ncbi:polycystic kidney disease protein 1-like 3 isoform X15 [Patella vulgata]|uniref:polycystic kidney disease protein 1-like 3 isoform X15 n=1 Tax=Patella vulgata TaxID=6465 RepID=UPI0021804072|nr:polycystic kidney disease protein 1-like 3 isoform X15 [Patella vulgata]
MSTDEKSANQFISALVKNLQAVCHGHVDFDKNVKVVGHLYLTVDSNSEFNYIVNEKVSKSDESSTTFISKSFYATDPQQKTPKKNLDRPLPPPTPNVLGKTRYDISVDLTDDHPPGAMGGGRYQMGQQRGQFSRPGGFPVRAPQMRRRPFDQRMSPQQIAKMPRLSSPQRHPMNLPSTSPRRMPNLSSRLPAPSSSTVPSISSETNSSPSSIPPESVSATPAQSLPGADKPEKESGDKEKVGEKTAEKPDIKFEVIKVENGSVVASNKDATSEGEEKELRIESVTSHDLSFVPETEKDKDSESKNSETSDSDKPASDPPPETLSTEATETAEPSTPNKSPPKSNEPEVIEIDLTKVKDEIDSTMESDTSYMYDDQGGNRFSSGQGDNSLSSFGGESNDDEFFASLREQSLGLYPVGLHANESNNPGQNLLGSDIPNLPGTQHGAGYLPVAGTSTSSPSNQPVHSDGLFNSCCRYCGKVFKWKKHLGRHIDEKHLNIKVQCPICLRLFTRNDSLKDHIRRVHKENPSDILRY